MLDWGFAFVAAATVFLALGRAKQLVSIHSIAGDTLQPSGARQAAVLAVDHIDGGRERPRLVKNLLLLCQERRPHLDEGVRKASGRGAPPARLRRRCVAVGPA